VPLLNFAGTFNGLILPVGMAMIPWVALLRPDLLGGQRYPPLLGALSVLGWLLGLYLGWRSIENLGRLPG